MEDALSVSAEKSRAVTTGKDFKKRFRRDHAAIVIEVSASAVGQRYMTHGLTRIAMSILL